MTPASAGHGGASHRVGAGQGRRAANTLDCESGHLLDRALATQCIVRWHEHQMTQFQHLIKPLLAWTCWRVRWDSQLNLDLSFGQPALHIREPYQSSARSSRVRAHAARRVVTATIVLTVPLPRRRNGTLSQRRVPPNKRLKLTGGDRSKGTGVLCPGGHGLSSTTLAPASGSPAA